MSSWLSARSNNKKVYGRRDNSPNQRTLGARGKDFTSATLQTLQIWQLCMPASLRTWGTYSQVTGNSNTSTQSCGSIIWKGAIGDVNWLRQALHDTTNAQRRALLPHRWKYSRRSRVLLWCQQLGFQLAVTRESITLEADTTLITNLFLNLTAWKGLNSETRRKVETTVKMEGTIDEIGVHSYKNLNHPCGVAIQLLLWKGRQNSLSGSANEKSVKRVPACAWGDALRRAVIGAWLTGEMRNGRLVADWGAEKRCGACVIDAIASKQGGVLAVLVSVARAGIAGIVVIDTKGIESSEALVARTCGAWPEGVLIKSMHDDFYVPAKIVEAKLPELAAIISPRACNTTPALPISTWTKVLAFAGKWRHASLACFGLGRALDVIHAEKMRSLIVGVDSSISLQNRMLQSDLPRGEFLAEGAFKKVYATNGHAVSIINLSSLIKCGDHMSEVARELEISCLLTNLVRRRCCPNFINMIDAFICHQAQPITASNSASSDQNDSKPDIMSGVWLYARMGLCGYGDIEGWLKKQAGGVLPVHATLQVFFQICFSIYFARSTIGLRHYDLKLLNFLVTPIETQVIHARYNLGNTTFDVHLCHDKMGAWAKLADFGTSHFHCKSMGMPAHGGLLTTVENTPVDILFGGDAQDTHAFTHDTFSLGLAALHLFGGGAPYEELMCCCTCPDNLHHALCAIWFQNENSFHNKNAYSFSALAGVTWHADETANHTLSDTFYRFLILLGVPTSDDDIFRRIGPAAKAVLAVARFYLLGDTVQIHGKKRLAKARRKLACDSRLSQQRFDTHTHKFNIQTGVHPTIVRCRSRLGPNFIVLKAMLDFDPRQRPTMRSILASAVFSSLKNPSPTATLRPLVFNTFERAHSQIPLPDV
jgi:serine/threonine protein kinase